MNFTLLTFSLLTLTLTLTLPTHSRPNNNLRLRLRLPTSHQDETVYCESWRFSVETNDVGSWATVPTRCLSFLQTYMTGPRYQSDTYVSAESALSFVRSLNASIHAFDAWVFGLDDTLLSTLPYYQLHGFGTEVFNEVSFNEWASLGEAPPIAASWILYQELQLRGFTIFILSGRDEHFRNITEANLLYVGFTGWKRLILRGKSDEGTLATEYKSSKRKEIVDEGYKIRGVSGDQWSDLLGNAIGQRSFKLPNVLYYVA